MPFSIDQIKQEHEEFLRLNPERQIDLQTFAKAADELYQTPDERKVAYDWGMIKAASTKIDETLAPVAKVTGDALGFLGRQGDKVFDTGTRIEDVSRSVGEGLPRFASEAALTAVPVAGQVGRVAQIAAKVAKAVGYSSAYARGYSDNEGGVAGGVLEAATLGAGNVLIPAVDKKVVAEVNKRLYKDLGSDLSRATAEGIDELSKTLAGGGVKEALKNNALRTGARIAATEGTGIAIGEVNRQARISIDGEGDRNPFTLENVVGNAVGALGFMPIEAFQGLRTGGIDYDRASVIREWAESQPRQAQDGTESFRSALDKYSGNMKKGVSNAETLSELYAAERVFEEQNKQAVPGVQKMARDENVRPGRWHESIWQDPNGNLINEGITHEDFANKRLGLERAENADPYENSAGVEQLMKQGWVRVAKAGNDIWLDGKPSRSQYAQLEKLAIEKGYSIYSRLGDTLYEPPSFDGSIKLMSNTTALYNDAVARGVMPSEFGQFVKAVNDQIFAAKELSKDDTFFGRTEAEPVGPSPAAIKQLQEKKYLVDITPDWIQKEFATHLERSLTQDPVFAYKALVETVSNRFLLLADEAKERLASDMRNASQKSIPSALDTLRAKDQATETQYLNGLATLQDMVKEKKISKEVFDEVIKRHLQAANATKNTTIDGGALGIYAGWRDMLNEALDNYNPEDGTTLVSRVVRREGKGVRETKVVSLEELITAKRENGQYVYYPKHQRVSRGAGGRSSIETNDVAFFEDGPTLSDKQVAADDSSFDLVNADNRSFEEVDMRKTGGETLDENLDKVDTTGDMVDDPEAPVGVRVADAAEGERLDPTQTPLSQVATEMRARIDNTEVPELIRPLEPWLLKGRSQPEQKAKIERFKPALNALIELQLDRGYISKEALDFARASIQPTKYEEIMRKSGEREVLRVAVLSYWNRAMEKAWTAKRPGESLPTGRDRVKLYQPILEIVFGPEMFEKLKVSPMAQSNSLVADVLQSNNVTSPGSATNAFNVFGAFYKFHLQKGLDQATAKHFAEIATRTIYSYKDIRAAFTELDQRRSPNMSAAEMEMYVSRAITKLYTAGVYSAGYFNNFGKSQASPLLAVALDFDKGNPDTFSSAFVVSVLVHEMTHAIEDGALRGAQTLQGPYAAQRADHYRKFAALTKTLTETQRIEMLENLASVVFPHQQIGKNLETEKGKMMRGFFKNAKADNEFIAMYTQMLALGKVSTRPEVNYARKLTDWLQWQHQDVISFTQGFYRDLGDQAEAVATLFENPDYRAAEGYSDFKSEAKTLSGETPGKVLRELHKTANAMLHIQDYDAARKAAADLVNGFSGLPTQMFKTPRTRIGQVVNVMGVDVLTTPYFAKRADDLQQSVTTEAGKQFWQEKDGKRVGFFSHFMPFFQLLNKLEKQGVPLAGDVWNIIANVQPGYSRLQSDMLSPMTIRLDNGKLNLSNDDPLIRLSMASQKDPKAMLARKAVNDIQDWQQKNDSLSAVARREDGSLGYSRDAAPWLERRMASVPPEWQQVVLNAVERMNAVYQRSAKILWQAQVSKTEYRIARLVQTLRPGLESKVDLQIGQQLTAAALNAMADPNPIGKFGELAMGVDPAIIQVAARYFFDSEGIAQRLVDLKAHLDSRPGFASEQRPGRYLIESRNKDGVREVDGAETIAHRDLIVKQLQAKGNKIVDVIDKNDRAKMTNYDAPDIVYEKAVKAEEENWNGFLDRMATQLRPDQIQVLRDQFVPGETLAQEIAVKGVGKFTAKREFVGGRERLDYIDVMRGYIQSLAGSVSRNEARNKMRLLLADARLEKESDFRARALEQLDWVMTPDSETATKIKGGLAAYYLGANFSSMLIEGTQSAVTLVPQLLEQGSTNVQAWKNVGVSVAEAWSLSSKLAYDKYVSAADKVKRGGKLTPEEERTYWFRKALDEGILDHGALEDMYDRDQRALMARKFGHGDYGDTTISSMVGNKAYQGSQILMWAYGKMSNFNQKVAFTAGLRQGQELGLNGQELYDHARRTKDLSMFGGGKANQPAFLGRLSNPHTKSTLGVMYTLQQYGLGMTSHLLERGRDALGANKKLSPQQRMQARRAFSTMLATQVGLAGALGLPFVGASLAVIEKLTGTDANAAVREGIASLAGEDEELGAFLSESALDGLASQFAGVDIGSRVGVSNLLGTSAYRGFSFQDMLGPAPSVVENMVNAVSSASAGNYWEASRQLVPTSFKALIGMGASEKQYGDLAFRDKSSNLLYDPSTSEAIAYAIGFRPRTLSQKQKAQSLLKGSDERYAKANDSELDRLARAMRQGDNGPLTAYIETMMTNDSAFDPRTVTSSVINRAISMDTPVDLLASGPTGNAQNRRDIAGTFGKNVVTRRSEVERTLMADQLNASTGYMAGPRMSNRELLKAEMLDMFTSQGMTRSQALRQLEALRL